MVTNFIVNKHDLQFILQQIKISEAHASGTDITEAIRQVYGVDAEDAALLPAGLRTVDGTLNNLLPGQAYFGAAQTKFPRLLDPVYRNDNDGDSIDFDGPGPSPAITNTDYGVIDGQGHVGTGTVVDADPRTISNLIATQDVSNPAAIRAALKLAGVEGPAQTAATNAISAAYRSTLNANGANAEVAAATAVVAEASANASAANAVLAAAAALQSLYAAGLSAAEGLPATMTTAQTAVQGLIAALLEITDEPAPVSEFNLSPPDQATFIDTVAYTAAHEAWLASDQTATEPQPTDFPDVDGYNAAKATFDNELEAQTLAEAQYDTAFAAYNATLATATLAYDTAVTAVGNAEAAAGDVVTALGDSTTPGVLTLQAMATTLRTAIEGIAVGTLNSGDAETVSGALADFTGAPGLAQSNMDDLGALKSIADTDLAAAQAEADEASAVLDAANAELASAQDAANTSGTPEQAAAALQDRLDQFGIQVGEDGGLIIENQSPDIGLSASFNTAMTIFGQFFDHGLDLVNKGGNGTVYIPLEADDPLIAGADKVFGTADDLPEHLRFMTLTRATPTWDADGTAQHVNATTPWVDQNQTYTSHASHQVFLREYVRKNIGDGEKAYSTGHLLDGKANSGFGNKDGALANWGEVKAQALSMLGIRLQDTDVHRVPLLLTDQYGNLILGNNGYAQLVMAADADHANSWLKEGSAQGITTEGSLASGVAFLVDIAHTAAPSAILNDNGQVIGTAIDADGDTVTGNDVAVNNRGQITEYDNELLDRHFISGDGRGNENIGLTAIHTVFHSEHNRVVEANKQTILDSGDRAFINEWLLVDLGPNDPIPTSVDDPALEWDGARLFQAGRFSTEMQYQHMVFEEFARRIQPAIDPFVFTNTADIDGSIIAEFAHTVYRFGHSMLNGSVDRLDNDLGVVGGGDQLSLIEAFLNPVEYLDGGTDVAAIQGALLRGMSRDVGNEIDEFVVPALQSNLLGLPLDLAALNIARGRETGVPSLNETRAQLSDDFGLPDLKPYTSWNDFVQNIKNPLSVINFIAAYGTHATVENAGTLQAKRDAATLLVLGGAGAPEDRIDFLNARGDYVSEKGGLDNVDLWIGGLAERLNEFGGMLGSTFNFIFEYQMERLQNGDRFYYLSRTQGLNMLNQLEQNTFSDIIMRNSDLGDKYATHLSSHIFVTPDMILELDRGIAQEDYNPDDTSPSRSGFDPVWDDPILQSLDPKVTRSYSGVTADGGHDVGGTLRFRGGEHVVIGGTEGDDRLISDIGDDTIWGDGGDDYINSGQGADEVYGGDGDDIIEDPFGENFLRGNAGNDVISTARGFTLAFGNEGSDAIFLGQDAAEAFGDEGNDFILGSSGPDLLHGGEGDDWIEGGEGFDVIAGENSELFFNSSIIGHDVAWGQGNDQDYDLESGDDIALSGIGVQRFEGMFGFDWSTAKFDVAGVDHDMAIPIFTTDPQQILRDRFDQMEALSGWKFDDRLAGDDRGQILGGVGPGAEAEASFINHILTQEGIDRIDGLEEWMGGARETLFGAVPGADVSSYRDGNILMGGNGNDVIMGRGGYDLIDGDAWLNVRIRIMVGGTEYTAESLTTDTMVAGAKAGRVYNVETGELAFGGRSLKSLLLDRTIKPGDMSIVREIKYDDTPQNNIDTAVFRGTFAEYRIEGRGHFIDFNGDGDFDDPGEDVAQAAYDLNGDGFIAVTDLDDGRTGAIVDGVELPTRNQLTDDTDLLKNIEMLQFSDQTIDIRNAANGTNQRATGLVEIADPTQLLGGVTPFVGQVLSAAAIDLADADGLTLGTNGLPQGFQIEWQSMLGGKPTWTTVATNQTEYTVRETDIEGSLRAVAVFKDNNGITERVYSAATATPTAPFSVEENAAPGTMVTTQIPPTHEGEAGQFHQIRAGFDAGGRFEVVQSGQDFLGNPLYQLVVAGGDMDYEFQDPFQIVDNQYQIVIDTYDLDPAAGGDLIDSREFTILLQDVVEAPPAIVLSIADAPMQVETGDTGATNLVFGLSVDNPGFSGTLAVSFSVGAAAAQTQAVSFAGGVGALIVPVDNDALANGTETVAVTLTGATGTGVVATLGTATANGMVTEDDVIPVILSITNAPTVAETGDTGTTDLAFGLSLDDTTFSGDLTVTYDTGSATNQTQVVSFAGGIGTLTVQVANDDVDDGDEMVTVTLTGATGTGVAVTLGTASASGMVTEDDVAPPPVDVLLSITNAPTLAETGDTGTTDLDFGLSLSDASFTGTLQVTYNAGSATKQSQNVSFTNGVGTLTMSVANDDVDDGDEMVAVTLTGATGTGVAVTLGTASASGTVTEDDVAAPPGGSVLPIDFNANPLLSYSGQDKTPQGFQIDQDGAGITLSGNTWKKTLLPGGTFTVDADTVLRFDVTMQNGTAE
ncbi:MAG: peroxidase family protein, partial [Limimaricola soesokkakensis]|uniref:peroxidase family protein n=1 Tax=Limimaricola soesokkakensis TaxID=1343159 RepID=UPI0040587406